MTHEEIDNLIKQDTTDDNRFASALNDYKQLLKSNEETMNNYEAVIKEKDEAILKLKSKNFDLISKIGNQADDKDESQKPSLDEIIKNIY